VEIVPTGVSYSGGLTYGIGFGYNINENIVIEANYLINNGSASSSIANINYTYSKVGLSFGYKF
jgi:opacity protein-like surface antigen